MAQTCRVGHGERHRPWASWRPADAGGGLLRVRGGCRARRAYVRSRDERVNGGGDRFPGAARRGIRRLPALACRHDPTFYLAVLRLPADVRPAVHALYGFVRGADEIVDGAGRSGARGLPAALDAWEGALERGLAGGTSDHPVIAALVDAGLRPRASPRGAAGLHTVDAGRLRSVRIASRAELDRYMDGSAASVGRVMAVILGARREAETFGRLGVAFQPTNFVRDVRVDYQLGRIYLPRRSSSGSAWMQPRSAWCRRRLSFAPDLGRGWPGSCSSARRRPPSALRCPARGAACASPVLPTSPSSTASRPSTTTSSRTRSAPGPGASRAPSLHDLRRSRAQLTRPRLRCIQPATRRRDGPCTSRASAESVVVEWHQHRSLGAQLVEQRVDFVCRVTRHEDRHRRREAELVGDRTVEGDERPVREREPDRLTGAVRAGSVIVEPGISSTYRSTASRAEPS